MGPITRISGPGDGFGKEQSESSRRVKWPERMTDEQNNNYKRLAKSNYETKTITVLSLK